MKEEMDMCELIEEQRRIEQQDKHIDKIMEIAGYVICLATIFIIVVHFI